MGVIRDAATETLRSPDSVEAQVVIDASNSEFWDELCGTGLARSLDITDASSESLARFDAEYWRLYPYLHRYVTDADLAGQKLLEIGLGFGSLGHLLIEQGADYNGLDIAANAVDMMRHRLRLRGVVIPNQVQHGSALEIPYDDGTFDRLYSIGCLHHTGNLPRAISEVHRVLRPGGQALLMLYNRYSWRQVMMRVAAWWRPSSDEAERLRAAYDANAKGESAPHTEYVSRRDIRQLLHRFHKIRIESRNMDPMLKGRISRDALLNNLGRLVGLDLYIFATKPSSP